MKGAYAILLNVTNYCNLNCKYCFLKPTESLYDEKEDMTLKTAKKATLLFLRDPSTATTPEIVLYGFEPLLNWVMLTKYIKWANKNIRKQIKNISIYTNGTLLDSEKIEFLIQNRIKLKISVDAFFEENYRNRKINKKTYEQIMNSISTISERSNLLEISMVITKETLKSLKRNLSLTVSKNPQNIILLRNTREHFSYFEKLKILKEVQRIRERNKKLNFVFLPEFMGCCLNSKTTHVLVYPNGDVFDICIVSEVVQLGKKLKSVKKENLITYLGNIHSNYSFSVDKRNKKKVCKAVKCPTIHKAFGLLSKRYRDSLY